MKIDKELNVHGKQDLGASLEAEKRNRLWRFLRSLKLANLLLAALVGLFFIGGWKMASEPAFADLNAQPLFRWLSQAPLQASWWLWAALIATLFLGLNTLLCSVESIFYKWKYIQNRTELLQRIAAQVIHLGFGLIMVAHLLSALDQFRGHAVLAEGMSLKLPDEKTVVKLEDIHYAFQQGYLKEISLQVSYTDGHGIHKTLKIAPNRPVFVNGYGLYLKSLLSDHLVLIEVSRDRGTYFALAGGVVFLVGTILLVFLRLRS